MIIVDGTPISTSSQGRERLVVSLLENPVLVSASDSFKALPERKISLSDECDSNGSTQFKCVYVFQREYATVDPARVKCVTARCDCDDRYCSVGELVGTDEATTCVGLLIRNPVTGMTSVAHMDSPAVVDLGISQMLSFVIDSTTPTELDVHLIGGYQDASLKRSNGKNNTENYPESLGYSFPLCSKILEALQCSEEKFHVQTLCILEHNTTRDSVGTPYPVVTGFLVDTCTGSILPATFDKTSRGPDEIVRRVRVSVSSQDPSWKGKLLDTYDTHNDRFQIAACSWSTRWKSIAISLQQLSDSEILLNCSTSPLAEGPDFVDNEKRLCDYLIRHPNWTQTFPRREPRIFEWTAGEGWVRC
ncbi:hypothetical protein Sjap_012267 [Stephania japonica]|uniref:Protein N-terminal asparagine amidohydrolase n=1 Tax=Stephania japonica TaxID=461633 RepID=A0AAP0NYQ8_9MAGN